MREGVMRIITSNLGNIIPSLNLDKMQERSRAPYRLYLGLLGKLVND